MITDPPTHLDLLWTDSSYVDLLLGFANGRRVIAFDRRGVGLSDSFDGAPTLEAQALDLEAVLDAAGAERPALLATADPGQSLPTLPPRGPSESIG